MTDTFGSSYASMLGNIGNVGQQITSRRAGAALASGDVRGAANTLLTSGDLQGGLALQQQDAARQQAQAAEQIAFTKNAVRVLRGSQNPLADFDGMAPALKALGTDDAQIAQLRSGLETGGVQFLDQIDRLANQQARELEIQNLGGGYGVAIDKATGEVVNEYRAPAGTANANGVIYNTQTGEILQDTRPPEYIQRDPKNDLIQISPGGGAQPPADLGPAQSAVASALANGGLSAPVVAGFMGNFHVEGGYSGGQGDGGSASGIAQWRNERRDAFRQRFGKDPHQATPEEQAQFVLWELNTPEGRRVAGLTEQQAQSIIGAQTPAEAARLIDQYYERSSGQHRERRIQAANSFAGLPNGSGPRLVSAGQPQSQGGAPGILTPAEVQATGLPRGTVAQRDQNGRISILQAAPPPQQQDSATAMADNLRTGLAGARNFINSAGVWSNLNPLNRQSRANLEAHLATLKGNITFSQLMEMKRNSPTGASGLGALSDNEARMLASTVAALDADMSPRELRRSLSVIERLAGRIDQTTGRTPRLRFQPTEAQTATARRIDTGAAMTRGARVGSQEWPIYINPNDPNGSYANVRPGQYFITPDGQVLQRRGR